MGAKSCSGWSEGRRLRWLLAVALVGLGAAAEGQQVPMVESAVKQESAPYRLSPSEGVSIAISKDGHALSREEMAQVLEQAARQLRAEAADAPAEPLLPAVHLQAAGKGDGNALPAAQPQVPEEVITIFGDLVGSESGPSYQRYLLPATLLWQPPLASQWAPRFFVKPTTLNNASTHDTIDTGIGGTIGIMRYSPDEQAQEGIQADIFGVCFSRWTRGGDAIAADYRFGVLLTFASGPWSGKFGYEHTSTHVGDELIERTGKKRGSSSRDEIALGLAFRFLEDFRLYGQTAYGLAIDNPDGNKGADRWDIGLEWASPLATGRRGQPFAAVDVEFRGDEDYQANLTTQLGWMWRGSDFGRTIRLAFEYYDGRSPYGQFNAEKERWFGASLFFDF